MFCRIRGYISTLLKFSAISRSISSLNLSCQSGIDFNLSLTPGITFTCTGTRSNGSKFLALNFILDIAKSLNVDILDSISTLRGRINATFL